MSNLQSAKPIDAEPKSFINNSDLVMRVEDMFEGQTRALNGLKNCNLHFLGQIICFTRKELRSEGYGHLGEKSLDAIEKILDRYGYSLGTIKDNDIKYLNRCYSDFPLDKRQSLIQRDIEEAFSIGKKFSPQVQVAADQLTNTLAHIIAKSPAFEKLQGVVSEEFLKRTLTEQTGLIEQFVENLGNEAKKELDRHANESAGPALTQR